MQGGKSIFEVRLPEEVRAASEAGAPPYTGRGQPPRSARLLFTPPLEAFDKVLSRRTRKIFLKNQPQYWFPPLRRGRLIVKDPIAALSSDWLARNFDL